MKSSRVRFLLLVSILACVPVIAAEPGRKGHHHFHASAAVIGMNLGNETSDASEGAISLASTGGGTASTTRDFDNGVMRYREAVSTVSGHYEGDVAVTTSTVIIHDLDILHVFRAGTLTAKLTCRHLPGEEEAHITFEGTEFENVSVYGEPVGVTVDSEFFSDYPTYRAMRAALRTRGPLLARKAAQYGWEDGAVPEQALGSVPASLVKELRSSYARKDGASNVLDIPGLGTIYLGEVLVKPGLRHLDMFRFVLDSSSQTALKRTGRFVPRTECLVCGSGSGGSVEGNGTPTMP